MERDWPEQINSASVVICATRRLVEVMHRRYADWQHRAGAGAWETPRILMWKDWLRAAATAWLRDRNLLLLNAEQAYYIWERVIRGGSKTSNEQALLHLSHTARAAARSWATWHEWLLDRDEIAATGDQNATAFLRWANNYQQRLQQHEWLDPPLLTRRLAEEGVDRMETPGALWLCGFDQLTAAQSAIVAALETAGVEMHVDEGISGDDHTVDIRGVEAETSEEELALALRHARNRVEEQPNARVAIVIPDLDTRLDQVEHLARNLFYPGAAPWSLEDSARAYHVSIGRRLAEQPLIGAARSLLALQYKRIPFAEISGLLRSDRVRGAEHEWAERLTADRRLRRQRREAMSLAALLRFLEGRQDLSVEHLVNLLRDLLAAAERTPARQSPRGWAQSFDQWLRCCGWPGEAPLGSHDHQLVSAWRDALQQMAHLSLVDDEVSLATAMASLDRLLREQVFQPRSAPAPVEIVGLLDAAGQEFDHLWLTGMTDATWPPPARPDPFIPTALQKRQGLPWASAQATREWALRVTQRLLAAAPNVTISYARTERDERFSPSPVFGELRFNPAEPDSSLLQYYCAPDDASAELHKFVDETGPALESGDQPSGGAQIFSDQSRCPFRGFARHRLAAQTVETVEPGLDAAERGQLVHRALERFWREVKDQNTLLNMSREDRRERVSEVVAELIDEAERFTFGLRRELLRVEQARLEALLLEWLDLDAHRPSGFEVVGLEQEWQGEIGALPVSLKIDRVDRLEDGSRMVVDYKTGRVSVSQLLPPRPEEPQLPLYKAALEADADAPVGAIAFAQVRRGESRYQGVAADDGYADGVRPPGAVRHADYGDWNALSADWRDALARLAQDFIGGDARVDPLATHTCRYCDLDSVCRIREIASRS